jgi:predicted transcriptional regulator
VVARAKGELRTAVLRILWTAEAPLSAKQIRARFREDEPIPAITTLLTVLDRLGASGLVMREPSGSGEALFAATAPESQFTADAMIAALQSADDSSAALLRFAGELDEGHLKILRNALNQRPNKRSR